MRTNLFSCGSLIVAAALLMPSLSEGQAKGGRGVAQTLALQGPHILNVESLDGVPGILKAPFTADATTEFTQVLSDGNRIEQRFTTSLARDGRGRTRSEQEVAMIGPLVALQKGAGWTSRPGGRGPLAPQSDPPRLVVITDPAEGTTYTLNDQSKEARRTQLKPLMANKIVELNKLDLRKVTAAGASDAVVEPLGTRMIEGVSAEGVRSTTTIPAGEIGNQNPIHLVTERWFSKELQMAILITRRDPRTGETVYRLTSIVRAEPPPDLFTVPSDYRVVDVNKVREDDLKIELKKVMEKVRAAQP